MGSCANHAGVPAIGRCVACAEEFCHNCLVTVQGQKYCGSCKMLALGGKIPAAAIAVQEQYGQLCPAAKEALILGILSLFCGIGVILGPIGVIRGIQAHLSMNRDPTQRGRGFATTGIILGSVALLAWIGIFASR